MANEISCTNCRNHELNNSKKCLHSFHNYILDKGVNKTLIEWDLIELMQSLENHNDLCYRFCTHKDKPQKQ
jgi:hypothetical protein